MFRHTDPSPSSHLRLLILSLSLSLPLPALSSQMRSSLPLLCAGTTTNTTQSNRLLSPSLYSDSDSPLRLLPPRHTLPPFSSLPTTPTRLFACLAPPRNKHDRTPLLPSSVPVDPCAAPEYQTIIYHHHLFYFIQYVPSFFLRLPSWALRTQLSKIRIEADYYDIDYGNDYEKYNDNTKSPNLSPSLLGNPIASCVISQNTSPTQLYLSSSYSSFIIISVLSLNVRHIVLSILPTYVDAIRPRHHGYAVLTSLSQTRSLLLYSSSLPLVRVVNFVRNVSLLSVLGSPPHQSPPNLHQVWLKRSSDVMCLILTCCTQKKIHLNRHCHILCTASPPFLVPNYAINDTISIVITMSVQSGDRPVDTNELIPRSSSSVLSEIFSLSFLGR